MNFKIDTALNKFLEESVIEHMSNPTCTTPLVSIIEDHVYTIANINHLLSNLKGGGYYAKN